MGFTLLYVIMPKSIIISNLGVSSSLKLKEKQVLLKWYEEKIHFGSIALNGKMLGPGLMKVSLGYVFSYF